MDPKNWKLPERFDNTILSTWKTCPRKFQLFILEGLRAKGTSRALQFGSAAHMGLAEWYLHHNSTPDELLVHLKAHFTEMAMLHPEFVQNPDQMKPEKMRRAWALWKALLTLPAPTEMQITDHRDHYLLLTLLSKYFDVYSAEPFKVLYVEANFGFELFEGGPVYCGNIDLVVEWLGAVRAVEHKTTSSFWDYDRTFDPNAQITGYIIGLQSNFDRGANSATVNALQVTKRKDKSIKNEDFKRLPFITRSDEQILEFFKNSKGVYERIVEDIAKGEDLMMNEGACHQYGGCAYRNICKQSPGRERQVVIANNYVVDPWDPFKRENISKSNIE